MTDTPMRTPPMLRLPARVVWGSVAGCLVMLGVRSASSLPPWLDLHVSNPSFTLLGMLVLSNGRLQQGFTLRWLRWYCAAFAAINLIVETRDVGDLRLGVMSFSNVNTADPLHALFGLAGIAALLLLLPRFATVVPDDPPGAA